MAFIVKRSKNTRTNKVSCLIQHQSRVNKKQSTIYGIRIAYLTIITSNPNFKTRLIKNDRLHINDKTLSRKYSNYVEGQLVLTKLKDDYENLVIE